MYFLLSDVRLEEEEEYRDYLRITPECFEERFEGRSILQNKLQMQEMQALHNKTKTCCENIYFVHFFVILFS